MQNRLDRLLDGVAATDAPGFVIAVLRGGETVYQRCTGLADLEHGLPLTPASRFCICSISKQFTAAGLAMLAAEGRLRLDASVRAHLPELPASLAGITLRQLLNHTTGLRDHLSLFAVAGVPLTEAIPIPASLALICRQRTLDFSPGARFRYSNSNFLLAGLVIERVSGQPLPAFLRERIFAPLGMDKTLLPEDPFAPVPDIAREYVATPDGFRHGGTRMQLGGEGGILSTLDDMLRWYRNLRVNRLSPPDLVAQLAEPGRLNDGGVLQYGLGLRRLTYRGRAMLEHTGGLPGYATEIVHFPVEDVGVLFMANRSDARPAFITRAIADLLLDPAGEPPPPRLASALPGEYVAPASGHLMTIVQEAAQPVAKVMDYSFGLEPDGTGGWESLIGPHPLHLAPDQAARHIAVTLDGGIREAFERQPAEPLPALPGCHGTYATDELPATWRITEAGGEAVLQRRERLDWSAPMPLRFLAADLAWFQDTAMRTSPASGTLRFIRDAAGNITGFLLNLYRVANLHFARQ
jgi:D-aminopeptidase